MTETEIERLVVRLTGDGSSLQKMWATAQATSLQAAAVISGAAKQVESMGTALKGIGAGVTAFLGIRAAFAASLEMEAAQIKLKAAIEGNGGEVEKTLKLYKDFAGELKSNLGIAVSETNQLLKMSETFGLTGEAAKEVTKNAIAMGAATDQDAQSMVRFTAAMAKGDLETAQHMARMIPQLRGIKDQAEFTAKANQLLGVGFRTAGELANSTGGILKRFWETLNTVGGKLAKGILEGLQPAIKWVTSMMDGVAKTIQEGVAKASAWMKESMAAFVEWVKPVFSATVGALSAGWEAVKIAATICWIVIHDGVLVLWDAIRGIFGEVLGLGELTWGGVRDFAIDALLMVEFGLRNLMPVMNLVMAYIRMKNVETWNNIVFYITEVVPAALQWLGDNWGNIWQAMHDIAVEWVDDVGSQIIVAFTKAVESVSNINWSDMFMAALGAVVDFARSVLKIFMNVGAYIYDALFGEGDADEAIAKVEDTARQAAEAAKQATANKGGGGDFDDIPVKAQKAIDRIKPFVIPVRVPTDLEDKLRKEFEDQKEGAVEAWDAFRKRRLEEMGKNDDADKAKTEGGKWGDSWAKGASEGVKKLEASLMGSSASFQKIADYLDMLGDVTTGTGKKGKKGKGVGGGNAAFDPVAVAQSVAPEVEKAQNIVNIGAEADRFARDRHVPQAPAPWAPVPDKPNLAGGDKDVGKKIEDLKKDSVDVLLQILDALQSPPPLQAANIGGA